MNDAIKFWLAVLLLAAAVLVASYVDAPLEQATWNQTHAAAQGMNR